MKRTRRYIQNGNGQHSSPTINYGIATEILSRMNWARMMGEQYGGKRKLYEALGYPTDAELTFQYFYSKYDRQDIARAVVDAPCDDTWKGNLVIVEPKGNVQESPLNKAWMELDEKFSLKKRLNKVDKLCELGRYSILLVGLDDVKKEEDFRKPVAGTKRKLLYIKQIAESEADIHTWEKNPNNERYGMPLTYKIKSALIQSMGSSATTVSTETKEIVVHYTRLLHYVTGNLTSEIYGVSKLKPIVNRLVDLEKILGGDAETFWRGARPGYTATEKDDYELDASAKEALMTEFDNYEHDLRRFITAKGVDINELAQQIADPLNHIDAQLQAISAQTRIPKRILIGSERGELSSGQDRDQWLSLIQARQHEHAEPTILRPFINMLMMYGILPAVESYNIMWEDVFAPSDSDKATVGKSRSEALKTYSDSPIASMYLSPELALKYLLGLNEEQVQEALKTMERDKDLEQRIREKLGAEDNPSDDEFTVPKKEKAVKGKTKKKDV